MPDNWTLAHLVHRVLTSPPRSTWRRVRALGAAQAGATRARRRDSQDTTYLPASAAPVRLLQPFSQVPEVVGPVSGLLAVAAATLEHRFDLLGSGPVVVRHGMTCAGTGGHLYPPGPRVDADSDGMWLAGRVTGANEPESRRIWRLVDFGYSPIDWHLDFKSGWRWSETNWYRDVRFGNQLGADVKVPWELSRMQHLPQLAVAYSQAVAGEPGLPPPERCVREFRNEVLDFIATNPPRYGVNWCTTMDVALRVSNWLVAHDLFIGAGAALDEDFEVVFRRSILEHARHIAENLEWWPDLHGNHYLADVVGLLFAAAHLPPDGETDGWLAFAIHQLIAETGSQFHPDGTNFEASTAYHRLSSEMVGYAAALVLGLPDGRLQALLRADPSVVRGGPSVTRSGFLQLYVAPNGHRTLFPPWFLERLDRMAGFLVDVTKPNGRAWQVGDNDSGRFVVLLPDRTGHSAHDLDFTQTVAAIEGVTGARVSADPPYISNVTRALSGGRGVTNAGLPGGRSSAVAIGDEHAVAAAVAWLDGLPAARRLQVEIPLDRAVFDGAIRLAYPDFGAFILRSERAFLGIRCGPVGQNGFGGHAHNDQLAIELHVDGVDLIADPGTYVYTPLPEMRNAYRSSLAHFGPRLEGGEPRSLGPGLFRLGPSAEARCLYWGRLGFVGEAPAAGGRRLVVAVMLEADRVVVTYGSDGCNLSAKGDERPGWRALLGNVPFSGGYGRLDR